MCSSTAIIYMSLIGCDRYTPLDLIIDQQACVGIGESPCSG
jgi:hypothetical protein